MSQRPKEVGLIFCQQAIIEEGTQHVTVVNCLRKLRSAVFPTRPREFVVCVTLTDGVGRFTLDLAVTSLDTLDDLYTRSVEETFTDRLREIRYLFRVASLAFPQPGRYAVSLDVGQERVAHSVIEVASLEGQT